MGAADRGKRLEAVHDRHVEIEHEHVGTEQIELVDRNLPVRRRADEGEPWFGLDGMEVGKQLGLIPDGPPPKALIAFMRFTQKLKRGRSTNSA